MSDTRYREQLRSLETLPEFTKAGTPYEEEASDTPHREGIRDDDRAMCLEMLTQYHRQEVPLLQTMPDSLPEELISNILLEVVINNSPHDTLHLQDIDDLHLASASILSTGIAEAAPYRYLLERIILENLSIRLDVDFSGTTARLPDFADTLLARVRKLAVRIDLVRVTTSQGNRDLWNATCGMANLASQLSPYALHEFILEISFMGPSARFIVLRDGSSMSSLNVMLDHRGCFVNATQRGYNRTACEALVKAVQTAKAETAKLQFLKIEQLPKIDVLCPSGIHENAELRVTRTPITSTRSAAEIVESAVQRNLHRDCANCCSEQHV
jgi:hypothetical protein